MDDAGAANVSEENRSASHCEGSNGDPERPPANLERVCRGTEGGDRREDISIVVVRLRQTCKVTFYPLLNHRIQPLCLPARRPEARSIAL